MLKTSAKGVVGVVGGLSVTFDTGIHTAGALLALCVSLLTAVSLWRNIKLSRVKIEREEAELEKLRNGQPIPIRINPDN